MGLQQAEIRYKKGPAAHRSDDKHCKKSCRATRKRRKEAKRSSFSASEGIPAARQLCGCSLPSTQRAAIGTSAFAHIGGFAAEQEVLARRREEIAHLAVFAEPSLVLRTSRNDHDVTWAADPLFAAEAEFHFALEHPHDLLICVTVRLNVDAGAYAPPSAHPLVAGENAATDLFADQLLS